MAIDFKKCLDVAKMSILGVAAIGIFQSVVGAIPFIGAILCLIGPVLWLATLVLLGWAGFKAAKAGMDIVGGAVTGAIAGAIGSLVGAIVGFVLSLVGIGAGMAMGSGGDAVGTAVGVGFGIVGLIVAPIVGAVIGAVFGAIGFVVAGMKK